METCPIASQFGQSRIIFLPNTKYTLKNLPKSFKIVPKWRNFAKSGHTVFVPSDRGQVGRRHRVAADLKVTYFQVSQKLPNFRLSINWPLLLLL